MPDRRKLPHRDPAANRRQRCAVRREVAISLYMHEPAPEIAGTNDTTLDAIFSKAVHAGPAMVREGGLG